MNFKKIFFSFLSTALILSPFYPASADEIMWRDTPPEKNTEEYSGREFMASHLVSLLPSELYEKYQCITPEMNRAEFAAGLAALVNNDLAPLTQEGYYLDPYNKIWLNILFEEFSVELEELDSGEPINNFRCDGANVILQCSTSLD